MTAGSPAAYAKAGVALEAMAAKVYRLGDKAGNGSKVKIINQLLAGVHIAAAAEAMALGLREGVETKALYEVITHSAGNSWMFENRMAHVLAADYTPLSAVDIFVKDLGLVLDTAQATKFPLPLSATAHQMFMQASTAGYGREDDSAVIKIFPGITLPTPQGSYGIQKFIGEQLMADFSRRGLVQGRSARLMTVAVRPGRPNGAASSFLSSMVREPLAGQRAVVPVAPDTPVALASPGQTIRGLLRALQASADDWGPRTAVNLPAVSTTVGEIAAALARLAGTVATGLLDWVPDARISAIVGGWPSQFNAARARGLGLVPDASIDALLQAYAQDHPDAIKLALTV